jgi:hypothetical protein|nr:MAG TPA: hypothetical protein [Bacteriophage sp.]
MAIKAYKGFNKDMTCKGFQYEEGKEYETDKAEVCETGFHACEYPLDCFRYYTPSESVFHEVEQDGVISRKGDDTKLASTKIKIGVSLNIAGMVKAAIEYTKSRTKKEADSNSDYGASSATGYKGASSATGDYGASSATGNCGASSATGYKGASSAEDKDSIAVAWGYHGKAKGVVGSYLVLADWEGNEDNYWAQELWTLKGAKMVRVDGDNIKEDTFYTMRNGKIVECKEE